METRHVRLGREKIVVSGTDGVVWRHSGPSRSIGLIRKVFKKEASGALECIKRTFWQAGDVLKRRSNALKGVPALRKDDPMAKHEERKDEKQDHKEKDRKVPGDIPGLQRDPIEVRGETGPKGGHKGNRVQRQAGRPIDWRRIHERPCLRQGRRVLDGPGDGAEEASTEAVDGEAFGRVEGVLAFQGGEGLGDRTR